MNHHSFASDLEPPSFKLAFNDQLPLLAQNGPKGLAFRTLCARSGR